MRLAPVLGLLALIPGALPGVAQAQQRAPSPQQQAVPPPFPSIIPVLPRDEMERRFRFDLMGRLSEQGSGEGRYRIARRFADCAQRVSPRRVAALLEKPVASPAERRAANSLMRFAPGCLAQPIVISISMLRGAAAEAVLAGFRNADPQVSTTVESSRLAEFFAAAPDLAGGDDGAARIVRFTQCQVVFAPGLVRSVLAEEPDSAAEKKLRVRLSEATALCGSTDLGAQEAALIHRSYLAEALYHWTRSGGEGAHS